MSRNPEVFFHEHIRFTTQDLDEAAHSIDIHDDEGYEYPVVSAHTCISREFNDISKVYQLMVRLRVKGTAVALAAILDETHQSKALFCNNKKAFAKIKKYVWRKIFN